MFLRRQKAISACDLSCRLFYRAKGLYWMINLSTWKKSWALLDARERRNSLIVLCIVIVGALSSALMVGSVLPFLSVLADPTRIETTPALVWSYETFGFTSDYG